MERVKIGDTVTAVLNRYILEQGEVVFVFSSGMVMLKGGTQPAWPIVSKEEKNV